MTARAWTVVPIVALLAALMAAGMATAQQQVDAGEFAARLEAARGLAQRAVDDPSPERMAAVRDELGLPLHVAVGEWSVEIASDPLAGLSGTTSRDFERAVGRLAALVASVDEALASDVPAPERVATALDGAYRGIVEPRPNPAEAVLQLLGEGLGWILSRISEALGAAGSPIAWLVVVLVLGAVAVLIWRRATLVPDRVLPSDGREGRPMTSVDWNRRADEAIRAGDLREAVRALYLALLVSLAGRGLLVDAPALTAGEAVSAVSRSRPALLPAIARATASYERVVYGGAVPEPHDLDDLRLAATMARGT